MPKHAVSRIPVKVTGLTGTAAVMCSAVMLAATAWADEPANDAPERIAQERDQKATAAQSRPLKHTRDLVEDKIDASNKKLAAMERARELARQRAIAKREAAERAREQRAREQAEARASRGQQREPVYSGDPRAIAQSMLGDYGWPASEFDCLDALWEQESSWDPNAENPSSGAYGIPQALPGSKMASAGGDWQSNPATQIEWGLGYIQDRYGSPCGAWEHSQANGWY